MPGTHQDAARDHPCWPSRSPTKCCLVRLIISVHRHVPMCQRAQAQQQSPWHARHHLHWEGTCSPLLCLVWAQGLLSAQPCPRRLGMPLPTHLL